jgi:hypothetical protein
VTARFAVDLLHPGALGRTWRERFLGASGARRLGLVTVVALGVLLLILVAGLLPTHWRKSEDASALPGLREDLRARDADLGALRANLRALGAEARQQVRWGEVLTALSRETPPTVRLSVVDSQRPAAPAAPPGAPRPAAPRPEQRTLRVDAVTPLRPGAAPLLDVARFMAALMRDPALARRFTLTSWEIKPPTAPRQTADQTQFLTATVVFTERAP